MDFWDRVNYLLNKKGYTRNTLAKSTGISKNTLNGWIGKKRVPRVDEALLIAKTLDTTIDYLETGRILEIEDDEEMIKIVEGLHRASRDDLMKVAGIMMTMGLYQTSQVVNRERDPAVNE